MPIAQVAFLIWVIGAAVLSGLAFLGGRTWIGVAWLVIALAVAGIFGPKFLSRPPQD